MSLTYFQDQVRVLMDKPTNIRNMSVIAHGTSTSFLSNHHLIFYQSTTESLP